MNQLTQQLEEQHRRRRLAQAIGAQGYNHVSGQFGGGSDLGANFEQRQLLTPEEEQAGQMRRELEFAQQQGGGGQLPWDPQQSEQLQRREDLIRQTPGMSALLGGSIHPMQNIPDAFQQAPQQIPQSPPQQGPGRTVVNPAMMNGPTGRGTKSLIESDPMTGHATRTEVESLRPGQTGYMQSRTKVTRKPGGGYLVEGNLNKDEVAAGEAKGLRRQIEANQRRRDLFKGRGKRKAHSRRASSNPLRRRQAEQMIARDAMESLGGGSGGSIASQVDAEFQKRWAALSPDQQTPATYKAMQESAQSVIKSRLEDQNSKNKTARDLDAATSVKGMVAQGIDPEKIKLYQQMLGVEDNPTSSPAESFEGAATQLETLTQSPLFQNLKISPDSTPEQIGWILNEHGDQLSAEERQQVQSYISDRSRLDPSFLAPPTVRGALFGTPASHWQQMLQAIAEGKYSPWYGEQIE